MRPMPGMIIPTGFTVNFECSRELYFSVFPFEYLFTKGSYLVAIGKEESPY